MTLREEIEKVLDNCTDARTPDGRIYRGEAADYLESLIRQREEALLREMIKISGPRGHRPTVQYYVEQLAQSRGINLTDHE